MLVNPTYISLISLEINRESVSEGKRRKVNSYGNKIERFFELNYSIIGDEKKERFIQELKKSFDEYVEVKFLSNSEIVIRKKKSEWTEAELSSVLRILHQFER
ncbi:MAG: hypothetical protein ACOX6Q_01805 [Candidatus Dojkabacteria bacterium]|jgi:hypothetical protein